MNDALGDLVTQIAGLERPVLLAFDVDGTLCAIVEDPAAARVPMQVQADLQALCEVNGVFVALVTGRDLSSLRTMVEVPGAYLAVEHGGSIVHPQGVANVAVPLPEEQQKLAEFAAWAALHALPYGALLEEKRGSRALHVRGLATREPARANELLAEATQMARKLGLHPRQGKAVLEAELHPSDKGTALAELAAHLGAKGVMYAGDDLTDLHAIQRAVDLGGVGIFVRSSERPKSPVVSTATVDGPQAVWKLVAELLRSWNGH